VTALAKLARRRSHGFHISTLRKANGWSLIWILSRRWLVRPDLEGWDGLGLVWQTYGTRSPLDRLVAALAKDSRSPIDGASGQSAYWTRKSTCTGHGAGRYAVLRPRDTDPQLCAVAPKITVSPPRALPADLPRIMPIRCRSSGTRRRGTIGLRFQRLHGHGEAASALPARKTRPPGGAIYARSGNVEPYWPIWSARLLETGPIAPLSPKVKTDNGRDD